MQDSSKRTAFIGCLFFFFLFATSAFAEWTRPQDFCYLGTCRGNLTIIGSLVVFGDFMNISVIDYNVTGNFYIEGLTLNMTVQDIIDLNYNDNSSDNILAVINPLLSDVNATIGMGNSTLNVQDAQLVNSTSDVQAAQLFNSSVEMRKEAWLNITAGNLDMQTKDIENLGGLGIGMTHDGSVIDASCGTTCLIAMNSTVTNASLEQNTFTLRNWDSSVQPFMYLRAVSDGSNNEIRIGGGAAVYTGATSIKMYTGTDYYTANPAVSLSIDNTKKVTFAGNLTFTGNWITGAWSSLNGIGIGTDASAVDPLVIVTGSTGGILMESVITNATSKEGRLKVAHYDTNLGSVIAFGQTNKPTANELRWGGGYTANLAATDHIFYTGEDNYDFSGIERFHIYPNGSSTFQNGSVSIVDNLTVGTYDLKSDLGLGVPTGSMAFSGLAAPAAGMSFNNYGYNFTGSTGATSSIIRLNGVLYLEPIATAPATCVIGDFYVDTSGAYCACTAVNTWTDMTVGIGLCT